MTTWTWPGSRWWKCDFHVHTPGSHDYREKGTTPEQWVAAAVKAGLGAVAVTDHNTAEWIDKVREAAFKSNPPIVIFPGVEMTVESGQHLLVLFDPSHASASVWGLLTLCGVPNTHFGDPDAHATCSMTDAVAKTLSDAVRGLPIPAHVDGPKGIVRETRSGKPFQEFMTSSSLIAVEYLEHQEPTDTAEDIALMKAIVFGSSAEFKRRNPLARLHFSDAHRPSAIGARSTWIKMTKPDLEGLRLALQDGNGQSVLRDKDTGGDPNRFADNVIESLTIGKTKFIGRMQPTELGFNPWLNTLIGGRGTGKSSVIEFARFVLDRVADLPEELRGNVDRLLQVPDEYDGFGVLLADSKFEMIYRKQGSRYRLTRTAVSDCTALDEEDFFGDGWSPLEGVTRQLFPVSIYSQKQIFMLAEDPNALLKIIDESPNVDRDNWQEEWTEKEQQFRQLREDWRSLSVKVGEETKLKGELTDIKRRIKVYESQGHSAVLMEFQRRNRQSNTAMKMPNRIDEFVRTIAIPLAGFPEDLVKQALAGFRDGDDPEGELSRLISKTGSDVSKAKDQLISALAEITRCSETYRTELAKTNWHDSVQKAKADYADLTQKLKAENAGEPEQYKELLVKEEELTRRLTEIEQLKQKRDAVKAAADGAYRTLVEHRCSLTTKRAQFLRTVLGSNPYVRIRLTPFFDLDNAEHRFRALIQRQEQFGGDILDSAKKTGVLYDLSVRSLEYFGQEWNDPSSEEWKTALKERVDLLAELKKEVHRIATDQPGKKLQDTRFGSHIQKIVNENRSFFDDLWLFFPDDSLDVSYSPKGDGRGFKALSQGSPGQKTAAILAFLLSHGTDPLILDQPEDDLDNRLIYDLIVKQIRENKQRRQIIVVTHNANIVVNGDAELVHALEVQNGQTILSASGGLQEKEVRREICEIMEGGKEAFERRYSRVGEYG